MYAYNVGKSKIPPCMFSLFAMFAHEKGPCDPCTHRVCADMGVGFLKLALIATTRGYTYPLVKMYICRGALRAIAHDHALMQLSRDTTK